MEVTSDTGAQAKDAEAAFLSQLDAAIADLDVVPASKSVGGELSVRDLRRSRSIDEDADLVRLTLTKIDGFYSWEFGAGVAAPVPLSGRRRPGISAPAGKVVQRLKFRKLATNKIGEFIDTLDAKCADRGDDGRPAYGLRQWRLTEGSPLEDGKLVPIQRPSEGPILLLVHGTFSNGRHLLDEILATDQGQALLGRAATKYTGGILLFDHPTLAVSPLLNSFDLATLLAGHRGPIDIVCHSRGGLVTRWFREISVGEPREGKTIFVGSPLRGTGLAAPDRLRSALALLTNFARVLEAGTAAAAVAVPMLSVVVGIQRVIASITSVGSRTPLFDAAIALIPGLAAQSAVSNNAGLRRLRMRRGSDSPEYYAICSNFESPDPQWQFWRRFRKQSLADLGADFLFSAQNDLVVDTASMLSLYGLADDDTCDLPTERVQDFGDSDTVHHLNYFRQLGTIHRLAEWLEIS